LSLPPALFLMGPTAAGKTDAALLLARRYPVEVISVDSALVYRGMDIGTAKPPPEVLAEVRHRLVDIRDPEEPYSAAEFREDALAAMAEITAAGRVPLLVGGTGLYFRALERGLAPLPPADPAVRAELAAALEREGVAALHRRLARVDPEAAARIHPHDPQRVLRALEVHRVAGEPMSRLWARGGEAAGYRVSKLVLAPAERGVLHRRIAARFAAMLERGLVAEVRALRRRPGIHRELPAMRAVGYRQVWDYLDGRWDGTELRERGVAATRQLAKRQLTWLRREQGAGWLDPDGTDLAAALAGWFRQGTGAAG
jgi:tRNA dimethylallyltransferase